jgi:hypothetical protein
VFLSAACFYQQRVFISSVFLSTPKENKKKCLQCILFIDAQYLKGSLTRDNLTGILMPWYEFFFIFLDKFIALFLLFLRV